MPPAPVRVRAEATTTWVADEPGSALLLLRAAAADDQRVLAEELTADAPGAELELELAPPTRDGARPARLVVPRAGPLTVRYAAHVEVAPAGRICPDDDRRLHEPHAIPFDRLEWTLPSRYCPSDLLAPTAEALFGEHPRTRALIPAVARWIRANVEYVPGASDALTTADQTLLSRQGLCRDMAHLAVTLLRALEVPARVVAAYAPWLEPPDFHALLEAHDGTAWRLVDVTGLAPVESVVRIATGRDAADVAWATTSGGLRLEDVTVSAEAVPAEEGRGHPAAAA